MGNCLKKTRVVEPTVVKDSASEILSRGTPFAKPDGQQQADMVKDLKDEGNFETSLTFVSGKLIIFALSCNNYLATRQGQRSEFLD